jgi:rhodanese-related sulfurtransferase
MTSFIAAPTLKDWLHDGQEIALFDVREHGEYGEAHLFYGVSLPCSRLESEALRLAPRKSVRLVLCDADGQSVAPVAAQRLSALGYTDVHVLQGGTRAWKAAGFALFAGVNLPSKSFGELVEQARHTPRVNASELAAMIDRGDNVVVLDGRPLSEFRKMSIPTATCCPNGELAYRVRRLVPDEATTIVVNCAGRTRSIVGAQTLIELGLRNPVFALENGTQGWFLQDLPLEHGNTRHYGEPGGQAQMREAAQALAQRSGVAVVDADAVRGWAGDGSRSLFLCDVRTPEEFAAGTLPGARHTPGGQLMQASDQYVGVRHARLVLFDSDGIRAFTVASWLQRARGRGGGDRPAPEHAVPQEPHPGFGVVDPAAAGRLAGRRTAPDRADRRRGRRRRRRLVRIAVAGPRAQHSHRRPGCLAGGRPAAASQRGSPARCRLHRLPVLRARPP